jgi:hypothetical protein
MSPRPENPEKEASAALGQRLLFPVERAARLTQVKKGAAREL